jgi:hypothetical protein
MGRFFPPAQIPGIDAPVFVRASARLTAQDQSHQTVHATDRHRLFTLPRSRHQPGLGRCPRRTGAEATMPTRAFSGRLGRAVATDYIMHSPPLPTRAAASGRRQEPCCQLAKRTWGLYQRRAAGFIPEATKRLTKSAWNKDPRFGGDRHPIGTPGTAGSQWLPWGTWWPGGGC